MSAEKKTNKVSHIKTTQKPTLRSIAESMGLALTTVSRALKNDPAIAQATRERVQSVAQSVGYTPDRAAQKLRTGKTNVISLVLNPHEEILGFGSSLISGLTHSLRGTDYHLNVMPQFHGTPTLEPINYILRNKTADAIVFSRTKPFDERVSLLLESDFPFICHGRTTLSTPHPYVDYDNFNFGYHAAKRLVEKGRENIVFFPANPSFTFSQHLQHGFMTAIQESGVRFQIPTNLSIYSPANDIKNYCYNAAKSTAAPDGYVCGGEVSALASLAGLTDAGLKIGEDVDIIGKQTSPLLDQIRPKIETIYEDLSAAGHMLGTLLQRRLQNEDINKLNYLQETILMFDKKLNK
ncbi:LacI family transcriptional regulator [Kiloniella sp. EL199]|uniref:LacI family transcriptional regulator n=1 Tax=Kiloniella sp. EL199 TaxID=2107581 RepID=UPI000EA2132F|nr:LacI family transcriptional regulator [Kiloniella sp. EL199]